MSNRPRIVGDPADELFEESQRPSLDPAIARQHRAPQQPLRIKRTFVEADEGDPASGANVVRHARPVQQGNLRQLPLSPAHSADAASRPAMRPEPRPRPVAPPVYDPVYDEEAPSEARVAAYSMLELAKQIQQIGGDLLVGAAVTTTSVAELAGNLITLMGRLVLVFPGQFVCACLLALGRRVSGSERDFGEAFQRSWSAYRPIPTAQYQLGPFEVPFSFVVGLSLLFPVLFLKSLELTNAIIQLLKP